MSKFQALQGRATQIPTNIKNLEQDVNVELLKFQDSPNRVAHKEDFPKAFRSRKGRVIEPVATLALGSRPRQKGLQGCEPRGSPGVKAKGSPGVKARIRSSGVTSQTPGSVKKCEGV